MAKLAFLPLLYLLSSPHPTHGYGSGAPPSQCGSLVPGHGLTPKDNSNTPYTIKLNSLQLKPGAPAEIELTHSGSEEHFKGYLVQARSVSDDSVTGTFETVSEDAQYVKCGDVPQSAVTHVFSEAKEAIKLKWIPQTSFRGKVKIVATFVKDYSTYWVKVPSETLEIVESTGTSGIEFPTEAPKPVPEPETEPETEPESEPEPETEPESEPEPEPESEPESDGSVEKQAEINPIYSDCGIGKSCFGVPAKCVEANNCKLLAAWKRSGDEFEFDLLSTSGSGRYVAVGFSSDANMGDELVMACANKNSAEIFWNDGKSPKPQSAFSGITSYEYSSSDGETFCKIKSSKILKSGSHTVDLTNEITLLLAGGPYNGPGSLGYHLGDKLATGQPVSLSLISSVGAKSDLLFRLHGLFMMCAWLGCAGSGMIMARYFKQTWKGKQILGADRWFQAHRLLMVTTVVLSLVGVVFILVEVDVQPLAPKKLSSNAHPVIGLICVLLALIQPIMAAFRPHPGDSGRKLFNWAHWGVGNLAHIFGICAIFLAGTLAKANLASTDWWSWVLLAYVVFHVITHVVFSLLWAKAERSHKVADQQLKEINGMNKIQNNNFGVEEKLDQEGGAFRKILFFMYITTAWVLVVVLAVAVFKAESA